MGDFNNHISPIKLMELFDTGASFTLVDVRKLPAFESSGQIIRDAFWRDHEQVETWGAAYGEGDRLIDYCVHGHEVSQNAAAKLCAMGVDACYLQGGFDAWLAAGGDVTHLSDNRIIKGDDKFENQ